MLAIHYCPSQEFRHRLPFLLSLCVGPHAVCATSCALALVFAMPGSPASAVFSLPWASGAGSPVPLLPDSPPLSAARTHVWFHTSASQFPLLSTWNAVPISCPPSGVRLLRHLDEALPHPPLPGPEDTAFHLSGQSCPARHANGLAHQSPQNTGLLGAHWNASFPPPLS